MVPPGAELYAAWLDGHGAFRPADHARRDRRARPLRLHGDRRIGRRRSTACASARATASSTSNGACSPISGIVDETTPVVAVVHDCQVVEEALTPAETDILVDFIATPTRLHEVGRARKRPRGVKWAAARSRPDRRDAAAPGAAAAARPRLTPRTERTAAVSLQDEPPSLPAPPARRCRSCPARPRAAAAPLTMQASWINDAEFSRLLRRHRPGLLRGRRARPHLSLGRPGRDPREHASSPARADLTLTTPDTTIKAIVEQGAPFKIIGAQYQKNPIGIVSLAKSADQLARGPGRQDAGGAAGQRHLGRGDAERSTASTRRSVNIVPYAYDPTPLIKGEIDASLDFTTNVPFTIKQAGEEAVSFLLYDHGFTIFNDTVVVTEETLKTKRKELVAWLRASRKGWEENFDDPGRLAAEVRGHLVQGHRPDDRERDLLQHRAEAADRAAERHLLDVGGEHRQEHRGAGAGRHQGHPRDVRHHPPCGDLMPMPARRRSSRSPASCKTYRRARQAGRGAATTSRSTARRARSPR